jgi:tetratricopeptide (TPR) repeat protein
MIPVAASLVAAALVLALSGCASGVATALKSLDNNPDVISINNQAQLAYEAGDDAKAEALYKSLVRRMPNDAETWTRLGNLYARRDHPDQAASAYEKALLANSSDARTWQNLGVVRLRQAWAAMLQAYALLPPGQPLSEQVEDVIDHLGGLPFLEAPPGFRLPVRSVQPSALQPAIAAPEPTPKRIDHPTPAEGAQASGS